MLCNRTPLIVIENTSVLSSIPTSQQRSNTQRQTLLLVQLQLEEQKHKLRDELTERLHPYQHQIAPHVIVEITPDLIFTLPEPRVRLVRVGCRDTLVVVSLRSLGVQIREQLAQPLLCELLLGFEATRPPVTL